VARLTPSRRRANRGERLRVHRVAHNVGRMRIALAVPGLAAALAAWPSPVASEPSRGLSLEQIRGVMRAHTTSFNACLAAATRSGRQLQGPFVYHIEVDRHGKVTSARPYHPSDSAAFDRCVTAVLQRARFPGGPAIVEATLPFASS
jgi:hypothetical protein